MKEKNSHPSLKHKRPLFSDIATVHFRDGIYCTYSIIKGEEVNKNGR